MDPLIKLVKRLSPSERENFKFLVSNAFRGAFVELQNHQNIASGEGACFLRLIEAVQMSSVSVNDSGVIWRGKPKGFGQKQIDKLVRESENLFQNADISGTQHVVKAGSAGIGSGRTLMKFTLPQLPVPLDLTGFINYAYYTVEGSGFSPHLDSFEYPVNAILVIKHTFTQIPSALVIFDKRLVPHRYELKVGELVIFYGECFFHYREPMKAGESLTVLAFGLRLVQERVSKNE